MELAKEAGSYESTLKIALKITYNGYNINEIIEMTELNK
jgi:hypothetical protein